MSAGKILLVCADGRILSAVTKQYSTLERLVLVYAIERIFYGLFGCERNAVLDVKTFAGKRKCVLYVAPSTACPSCTRAVVGTLKAEVAKELGCPTNLKIIAGVDEKKKSRTRMN